MRSSITSITAAAAVLGITVPAAGAATSTVKMFDATQHLHGTGRTIAVSGPLQCTEGAHAIVRFTLTQDGEIAEGRANLPCTGERESFHGTAKVAEGGTFEPGSAAACGEVTLVERGQVVDRSTWCAANGITLVD